MNNRSTKIKFSIHYECEIDVKTGDEAQVYMQMLSRYLPPAHANSASPFIESRVLPVNLALEANEKAAIDRALHEADGSIAIASRLLNITRATLYAKIRKYDLKRPSLKLNNGVTAGPDTSASDLPGPGPFEPTMHNAERH